MHRPHYKVGLLHSSGVVALNANHHCKTLGSLQPYILVISVAYLLCMAQLSRDNSNLKQGLKIAEKFLYVRVFLQKACNIGYTPAIFMQPRSSCIQEQMCMIKETPNLIRNADLYKSSARQFQDAT